MITNAHPPLKQAVQTRTMFRCFSFISPSQVKVKNNERQQFLHTVGIRVRSRVLYLPYGHQRHMHRELGGSLLLDISVMVPWVARSCRNWRVGPPSATASCSLRQTGGSDSWAMQPRDLGRHICGRPRERKTGPKGLQFSDLLANQFILGLVAGS